MAKHYVEVQESFCHRTVLGPLVSRGLTDGDERTIAPPREFVVNYKAGERLQFDTKKSAKESCDHHGERVRLVS